MPQLMESLHETAGATFAVRGGKRIPARYGDWRAEYAAATTATAVFDRSERARISVSGADAARFLHTVTSNAVEDLNPGSVQLNLLLNVKGQIQAAFELCNRGDDYLILTEGVEARFLLSTLQRLRLRMRVTVSDITEETCQFSLRGPGTSEVLARAYPSLQGLTIGVSKSIAADLKDAFAFVSDWTVGGCDIVCADDDGPGIWESVVRAGAQPAGSLAYEALRIQKGIPRYGPELNEHVLPPEVGLDRTAVSYEKGCYPGQEIMARIRNRGHVNRKLVGLVFEGDSAPAPRDQLLQGDKQVGTVTSLAYSPSLDRSVGVALLRVEVADGETVRTTGGAAAIVSPLPLGGI